MNKNEKLEVLEKVEEVRAYLTLEYWDSAKTSISELQQLLRKYVYGDHY